MFAVDLHQHLWPEPFLEQLRRRTRAPYLRDRQLVTQGSPAYEFRPGDHETGQAHRAGPQGGDRARVRQPLRPLGIESLPREQAGALIDAWHGAALDLPSHFAAWASVPARAGPGRAHRAAGRTVRRGAAAHATAEPSARLARRGEVLRVAELAGKPVFVHPGPTPSAVAVPSWWAPVVGYVAQLRAAWWAWHAFGGRSQFPRLRLVFAAVGPGWPPVHHERLTARGPDRTGRPGRVRRHLVVRPAGARRAGADARDRRHRAGQRPAVRRPAVAARRGGDAGGARRQPAGRSADGRSPTSRPREPRRPERPRTAWGQWHDPHRCRRARAWPRPCRAISRSTPCRAATSTRSSCVPSPPTWPCGPGCGSTTSRSTTTTASTPRCTGTPTSTSGCCAGPRERHRLPRPRHLVRSRRRGQRHPARAQPRDRRPDHRDPRRGRPRLQLRSRPHPPADRRRPRIGVRARVQPALWRMGQYSVGADEKWLRRWSVSYADELRPLD